MVPQESLKKSLGKGPTPTSVILSGPTATGKTAIALELARSHPGQIEIVNADSLLIYRHMDIGTAKPSSEELLEIPHHLINIREPNESFTAGDYVRQVHEALAEIHARGKRALLVGGSGFYLKALLYGLWEGPAADPTVREKLERSPSQELYDRLYTLDEVSALRIGVNDRYRLVRALELFELSGKTPSQFEAEQNRNADPTLKLMVIDRDNEELFPRITERTKQMLDAGFEDEVRLLRERHPDSRALSAVGYAQVSDHLAGTLPAGRKLKPGADGLRSEIELATRQLVKRQRTWFKGEKSSTHFLLDRDREILISSLKQIYSF
jgi:tRNA dimethylallyltransferase